MLITGTSKKGGRAVNEDFYGETRAKGILCAAVADGLGGHSGGSIASKLAVDTVMKEFLDSPAISQAAIKEYIKAANTAISQAAATDPEHVHMATTIVVLLTKGKHAIWANVGDSRLYRFRRGLIDEVTEDHSLAFMDFVNGNIEYDDIRTSPDQNKLTNALGPVMGEISVYENHSIGTDTSFLLCTDGWWEHVTEEDMEKTLKESSSPRTWMQQMLDIRENAAPENSDNYTAVAVMI